MHRIDLDVDSQEEDQAEQEDRQHGTHVNKRGSGKIIILEFCGGIDADGVRNELVVNLYTRIVNVFTRT